MPSWGFKLSKQSHGETVLGFYGSKTSMETPGPGAYDPYPFTNPAVHRTTNPRFFPDRSPGFRNVVDRPAGPWRPEPMSLSRLQSEQPLVHYASATFWAWPEQRRRSAAALRQEKLTSDLTRKGAKSGRQDDLDGLHQDVATHATMPRGPGYSGLARSSGGADMRPMP
eukprot:TRINITY_DN63951_c0_g1_i1.p1 TRINITY_DN63951_c0_g1~~TRINITY_DN63951_c0_g1_i1.p1  ORF type:complete len:168 (-),score=20.16 TRINITY_DN63951_c0_g1_i1:213-716(-)